MCTEIGNGIPAKSLFRPAFNPSVPNLWAVYSYLQTHIGDQLHGYSFGFLLEAKVVDASPNIPAYIYLTEQVYFRL